MNSKIFVFLFAVAFGINAHAVVTDVFNCKLKILNADGSELVSQSDSVAVIRKPEGKKDGYIFSRGDARFSLQSKESGKLRIAYVQLVIRHAIKNDQTGSPIAFQSSSLSPETFHCRNSSCIDDPRGPGNRSPGSPEKYGSRVAVINGVPAIDTNQFRESEIQFGSSQDGVARASCDYVGTYR